MTKPDLIRNFSIVAHIDHGKSTLAAKLLEAAGAKMSRQAHEAVDSMELERERGITIKAKALRMPFEHQGSRYALNLIDTPGHVDFSYEVSRALAACDGALLVVDASQGVEAQTLAHASLAQELGLALIPVINKVDLPTADVEATSGQIRDLLKIETQPVLASAKDGRGVGEILERILRDIPPPSGRPDNPCAALVFDSLFNPYRGVIALVRVFEGALKPKTPYRFFSNGLSFVAEEVGALTPELVPSPDGLGAGEVGYVVLGLKDPSQVRVGDTLMESARPLPAPLPGYREIKPVVFAGMFPVNTSDYTALGVALDKLRLEDSSFRFQPETSEALGLGYRLGFLGLLHLEIIRERLEREFGLDLIATSPQVSYRVKRRDGSVAELDNPARFPPHGEIESIDEPVVLATIMTPVSYQEPVLDLLKEKRGEYQSLEYLPGGARLIARYRLPLSEMIVNFYDRLKSASRGYASLDYIPAGFQTSDLVKLEILVHGKPVDALSHIAHRSRAPFVSRALCAKLKELISRQNFEVAVQARVEGRIIARETISAKRKDVLAKCYGGDITRKRKLLERQKEGKKKAKFLGAVEVPQEAFLAMLKLEGV